MSEGYRALRRGAAWVDVSNRVRIAARGRDRVRLLHNLTSNDVKKMVPGAGCYAFLLSPQGRIQADLAMFAFDDHMVVDTEPELAGKVLQHIRRYIVADQVVLEDVTAATAALAIEGPGAAEVLAAIGAPVPGADYRHLPWGEAWVAAISLTDQPGFRLYGASGAAEDWKRQIAAAGAVGATTDDVRVVRIENGRPRYGEDIRDTALPQETGRMHAVSFAKGCYLGQEIVERIRAQGHVNKQLVRLEIATEEAPPAGTKLSADGAEVGEITSAAYSPDWGKVAALGYVRTPFAEPGKELAAGNRAATVIGARS